METSLAIYEALIQATVPPPAARRVAECLERDMTSNLATKSDFLLLRQEVEHLGQAMATRFETVDARLESLESRVGLMLQNLETRLMVKLGTLMVVLFGLGRHSALKLLG
jgi:hypothetical protein